jgi:hypothetical protein
VVLVDAPPTIGRKLMQAIGAVTEANARRRHASPEASTKSQRGAERDQ